jgi:hypothetical protein
MKLSLVVGFTGTQVGMTDKQKRTFKDLIPELNPSVFRHGDCIGADEQAHKVVRKHTHAQIIVHPPDKVDKRAFCEGDKVLAVKPYLNRNHDIVDDSDLLIACPREFKEQLRSGTWATIRYARSKRKPVYIIWPDGTMETS